MVQYGAYRDRYCKYPGFGEICDLRDEHYDEPLTEQCDYRSKCIVGDLFGVAHSIIPCFTHRR